MANVPADLQLSEDQYDVWVSKLEMAYRASMHHERKWRLLREWYRGNYFENEHDRDRVTAPWHFVAVRQVGSALYFQDPSMNFTGLTAQGMVQARISEQVARFERKLIDADQAERAALFSALKYGTGILKYSWNTQFGEEPAWGDRQKDKGDIHGPQGATPADDALVLPQGAWTEHNLRSRFGHPHVRSIPPWDFLVDPDYFTYEEASWVAHRFHRRWIDAKNDKRWDDQARKDLEPTGRSEWYSENIDSEDWRRRRQHDIIGLDSALNTFYEIWDKSTQQIIVLSPNVRRALVVKPYPYQGADGPYEIIQFFPNDDDFWAIPYMDTFTPQILADAKLKTDMFDHIMRWSKTRGAYAKGRVSEEDIKRLAETRSGEFIGMQLGFQETIADILHILPTRPVSGDVYKAMDKFKADFDEVSGVSENARGGGEGVQTATEANIIATQSSLRLGDMRHEVDKMLRGSVRKMMGLLRQFWSADRVVPVVGPDGLIWDEPVSKDTINGDYDIDIEPGSTERIDRAARFRQNLDLLQQLIPMQPLLVQQGKAIDFAELISRMLVESDVVKNPDRIIFPITPQQMQLSGVQGQQQLLGPGATPNQPANVNGLDQIPTATDAFQDARQFSENSGTGVVG